MERNRGSLFPPGAPENGTCADDFTRLMTGGIPQSLASGSGHFKSHFFSALHDAHTTGGVPICVQPLAMRLSP